MECSLPIRVRYNECDPMGIVHHSVYPVWFEMGRIEWLRTQGNNYKCLDEENVHFVVTTLQVKYHAPAKYDDDLILITTCIKNSKATLTHSYELKHRNTLLTKGETVIACVDKDGQVQQIPCTIKSICE
tara:strand:+ start:247 stop:633 length:387 start_codon:yes stop_codon:yes gene_type:complete